MPHGETVLLTSSFPRFAHDYAGNFVLEHAKLLTSLGDLTVLAPYNKKLDSTYKPQQMQIIRFAAKFNQSFYRLGGPENLTKLAGLAAAPYGLASMLQTSKPYISRANRIITHWMIPGGLVAALFKRPRQKFQLIIHGGGWHLLKKTSLGKMLARFVMSQADDIIVVADYLKSNILNALNESKCSLLSNKIRVVPMGLHTDLYDKAPSAIKPVPQTILAVGRLVPIKGFDRLIEAASGLGAKIRFAGDGTEKRKLIKLAKSKNVDVNFLGVLSEAELIKEYHRSTVFAISSRPLEGREEGTPRAALEAMAAGCAIAASRTGGLPKLLKHNKSCLMDNQNIEQLHDNLKKLLSSRKLREKLSKQACLDVRQFDWKVLSPLLLKPFGE